MQKIKLKVTVTEMEMDYNGGLPEGMGDLHWGLSIKYDGKEVIAVPEVYQAVMEAMPDVLSDVHTMDDDPWGTDYWVPVDADRGEALARKWSGHKVTVEVPADQVWVRHSRHPLKDEVTYRNVSTGVVRGPFGEDERPDLDDPLLEKGKRMPIESYVQGLTTCIPHLGALYSVLGQDTDGFHLGDDVLVIKGAVSGGALALDLVKVGNRWHRVTIFRGMFAGIEAAGEGRATDAAKGWEYAAAAK